MDDGSGTKEMMALLVRRLGQVVEETDNDDVAALGNPDGEPLEVHDVFRMHDGLMLTERGLALMRAAFRCWSFETAADDDGGGAFAARHRLALARHMECPYYVTDRKLYVFKESYAVMIRLLETDGQDARDFALALAG